MIQRHVGDLLSVTRGIIVHGVNCQAVMGAGIAASIKAKWPRVFNHYRAACIASMDSKGKLLGTIDVVELRADQLYVVNAFTQVMPGPNASYDAIDECFYNIAQKISLSRLPICVPLIGCGIGGLRWPIVEAIIEERCLGQEVQLWVLP